MAGSTYKHPTRYAGAVVKPCLGRNDRLSAKVILAEMITPVEPKVEAVILPQRGHRHGAADGRRSRVEGDQGHMKDHKKRTAQRAARLHLASEQELRTEAKRRGVKVGELMTAILRAVVGNELFAASLMPPGRSSPD